MKFKLLLLSVAATILLVPIGLAQAAAFRVSNQTDEVIPTSQPLSNLYTLGQNVTVDAPITGDLAAAGQSVVVDGNVSGSVFAAGQTVNIRGNVGDHLRAAGGNVTLSGKVTGDVFIAAQTVTIDSTALISGDLYVAGNAIVINGTVNGTINAAAGNGTVTLAGTSGSVSVRGQLTVAATARINGNLTYHADQSAKLASGSVIAGRTTFDQTANPVTNRWLSLLTVTHLLLLIGWLLLGWLVTWLLPTQSRRVVERALGHLPASLGYGLLVLAVVPVVLLFLAISIIGLPIAVVLGGSWASAIALGSVFGKISLGALLSWPMAKNQTKAWRVDRISVLIGVVMMSIISLIPIIGGLVSFVFLLLGLGAVTTVAAQISRSQA